GMVCGNREVVVLEQDKRIISDYLIVFLHWCMKIEQTIFKYADRPLPHQLLVSWLKGYRRPNDKISGLKAQGILEPVKKGLYIAGPSVTDKKPDVMLV